KHDSAWPEVAACFSECSDIVVEVFENVEKEHRIELALNRERLGRALEDVRQPALPAQPHRGGRWVYAPGIVPLNGRFEEEPGTASHIEEPCPGIEVPFQH